MRYKHGTGYESPEYRSWRAMRARCLNPKDHNYAYYGGRGILITESWNEFPNFLEDMGLRPSLQHSLDRIDNEGDYEPGNCRWATKKEQSNNSRRTHLIEFNGKIQNITQWSEELGIPRPTLSSRIHRGQPLTGVAI